MTLRISRVLGTKLCQHYKSLHGRGEDCRLLVPGVTRDIAREVHSILREEGVTTYLLVGKDEEPREDLGYITPVGLTSKRIGSFVAVADPEQISHLQDSVRGTGGVVRSPVFSEEWPWADEGSPAFHFDGPVLSAILQDLNSSPLDVEWLEGMIREFRRDSRSSPTRTKLFFEKVLGEDQNFANSFPEMTKEALLFRAGVPCPQTLSLVAPELIKHTNFLCAKILSRYSSDGNVRDTLRERAREVEYEHGLETLWRDLDMFLDKLGKSDTTELGTLALHGCWSDIEHWRRLNAKVLADLFEISGSQDDRIFIRAEFTVDDKIGCEFDSHRTLAVYWGQKFCITVNYDLGAVEITDHKLQILNRRNLVREIVISNSAGEEIFELDSGDDFKGHRGVIPLRAAIVMSNKVQAHKNLRLHVCGPQRENFGIAYPPFEIADARARESTVEVDASVYVKEPVHLYLFSWNSQDVHVKDEGGRKIEIECGKNRWWRTAEALDITLELASETIRVCEFDTSVAVFSFHTVEIPNNEFTVEDAFVVETATGQGNNFRRLFNMFDGTSKELYPFLGGITGATQRRILLANGMLKSDGHWVVLTNYFETKTSKHDSYSNYVNLFGQVAGKESLSHISLEENALTLTQKYRESRERVVSHIRSHLKGPTTHVRHPLYATHPVFVANDLNETEALLCDYLKSYWRIVSFIKEEQSNLDWGQLFVISHLDCVVHWDKTDQSNRFFLAGPWHPVVLAKRFMVQSAIYERAQRKKNQSTGDDLSHLAVLLKSVPGFRWMIGLSESETRIEPAYTVATSDPGWHFATSRGELVDLEVKHALEESFGLSIHSERVGDSNLADGCIRNFHRAFPERRCISMRIRSGYSNSELIATVNDLLHHSDSDSIGSQLPGGVNLYFEDQIGEIGEVQWDNPPLRLFRYEKHDEDECLQDGNPDIYFLSPRCRVTIRRRGTDCESLPRGRYLESVFFHPLEKLTEGQARLPSSITFEVDRTNESSTQCGLGEKFIGVLSTISSLFGIVPTTSTEVELPLQLGAPWAILPQYSISPAALVQYVKNSSERKIQNRILWDYKFDIEGTRHAHYLLSTIPRNFPVVAKKFFELSDFSENFIVELGRVGIAIGSETLRSGRHALGVIGLIGSVRLLLGTQTDIVSPIAPTPCSLGFLIPIDSFPFFRGPAKDGTKQRADLLAVRLTRSSNREDTLHISACGIESKLVSSTFSEDSAHRAMEQAIASGQIFKRLVTLSLAAGGIPERLAMLELINFGLRISSPNDPQEKDSRIVLEKHILNSILSGNYVYQDATYAGVLISTEGGEGCEPGTNIIDDGLWLKLTKNHWPGIYETPALTPLRKKLAALFFANESASPCGEALGDVEVKFHSSADQCGTDVSTVGASYAVGQSAPSNQANDESPLVSTKQFLDSGPLEPVLIGTDRSLRPVYFDPQSQVESLENSNMMITGSPGTGKTQFIKYLACKIREQERNVLMVDLKNDFASDGGFCERAGLTKIFVSFDGLSYNPLIPYPVKHPETNQEYIQCAQHIEGVSSVLKKAYSLGPQQQAAVKNAIHEAFKSAGIPSGGTIVYNSKFEFPDFASVGKILERTSPTAYNRLDPLFRLELFRRESKNVSFEQQIATPSVIDLSYIPSDEIKNVLAQLIVLSAHTYYNSHLHSGFLRQFIVFDEAHRVLGSDYILKFARECRAYGVCLVLSSQFPTDFPNDVSASLATKVLHSNGRDLERVRGIVQRLGCEGKEVEISNLSRFEALADNRQYRNTLIRTVNYPLFLVWNKLLELRAASFQQLSSIDGVDNSKLHTDVLIKQLVLMGLASIDGDKIVANIAEFSTDAS